MNTKSSIHSLAALAIAVVAATLLHAAPPAAPASPAANEAAARQKVQTTIFAKVFIRSGVRFSRAGAGSGGVPSHRLEFQPQMLVDGEQRLPFTISRFGRQTKTPEWQGYVRLSDQEIFLLDATAGKYQPAKENPRFAPPQPQPAPPQPQPALPKIEPAKPL